jgi:hypothetical protein
MGFANNISRRLANELGDMICKELVYFYNQDGKRYEDIRGYVPDYDYWNHKGWYLNHSTVLRASH